MPAVECSVSFCLRVPVCPPWRPALQNNISLKSSDRFLSENLPCISYGLDFSGGTLTDRMLAHFNIDSSDVSAVSAMSCFILWINVAGPRSPDTWSNIILDVFVRVFKDEINIWISKLSKAYHPVIWKHGQKKRLSKRESPLPDWWSWNIGLFPPLDADWNMGSSWVSRC